MWPFTSAKSTQNDVLVPWSNLKESGAPHESILEPSGDDELPDKLPGFTGHANERLSIPLIFRGPLLLAASFTVGFSLGAGHGAQIAGFRYRAENAHRFPTTQTGWFLYHKSKNYHSIIGGVKEGVKLGGVLCGWATLFMCSEEIVDRARARLFAKGDDEPATGQRDAASTVVAAMTTAGVYSWKKGMDKFTAARTAKMALKYSLLYGLVQDLAATLRGNSPAYVEWLSQKAFGKESTSAG